MSAAAGVEIGTTTTAAAATAAALPRVRAGWIAAFATAWLGAWMGQMVPLQLLLPLQIATQNRQDDWIRSLVAFGAVTAVAGAFAVVAYPVVGALSDRTTSRFGRRRPWVLAGAVLSGVGLVGLGQAHHVVGTTVFWTLAVVGFCTASAALSAVLGDRVPEHQRGLVSGWISAPNAVGLLLGLVLATTVFTTIPSGYTAMGVAAVVLTVPFLLMMRERPLSAAEAAQLPRLRGRVLLESLWVNPRRHPDFAWTITSRVLVNLGNACATTMLIYFFTYQLHLADPAGFLVATTLLYMVLTFTASIAFGKLSDVIGRRRLFVCWAGVAQGLSAVILVFWPSTTTAWVGAVLLGLGQGCFFAVDQALVTDVLPSALSRGKDVGIMNIAFAVPQALGPLVGAGAVVLFGGFAGLFIASGLLGLLGGFAVYRVRSVP
ncbi:MFS/sugar transport protein [Quadrisphaera granulorum]|uniref:MFS transporter n=1 Tax=Quadrisphaera granulorum TaxID=317664 RepID=A0A316A818_9ACTN|nr:MFS transporter [Quadrisphaera granulorum]PWJ53855.1 MFS transporter [Quadrisphaera granulorum]SZE96612.1 MFS/sugar transport protein [Quadrisphaera granulorum]